MCGIAGFVLNQPIDAPQEILARMTRTLTSRGPDSEGYWLAANNRTGFGHRRLAVVDLSEHGHQPMHSPSRRFTITFNGEIYNFRQLRELLLESGYQFRGASDTEVALAAIEAWGLRAAVERFVGMFAFALWDHEQRYLHLVRDRLGKKPLYYGWVNGALIFASELKALKQFPGFNAAIDRNALALFLRHNYVPAPHSIYESVDKPLAGSVHTFDFSRSEVRVSREYYWSPEQVALNGKQARFVGTYADAVAEFRRVLEDAVRLRMIADVPLGAFLSGGIDSSLVVAVMAKFSSRPVKTFTIGFGEDAYDEAKYAKAVSAHIGTEHVEYYVTPAEALAVIPLLSQIYCEPFADSSQIPTYLVAKLARQDVTVALSGDGGDELSCGYNRYLWMRTMWRLMQSLPAPLRKALSRLLLHGGAEGLAAVMRYLGPVLPTQLQSGHLRERLLKLGDALSADDMRGVYRQLISHWPQPQTIVLGANPMMPDLAGGIAGQSAEGLIESIMTVDTATYLPDDILVKVDRASMACSLEVRAPLLDHRLFELLRSMPLQYQLQGSRGKLPLRSVLKEMVPESLTERPKTGFGVPIDSWLRGPLLEWAEDLLNAERLKNEGFLDVAAVRSVWQAHLTGARRAHYLIWDVLMFQSWLAHQKQAA